MECRKAKDESENGEESVEKSKGRNNIRDQSFRPRCHDKVERKTRKNKNEGRARKEQKNNTRREAWFCRLYKRHVRRFERMETRE